VKELQREWGRNIHSRRKALDLSQAQLAALVGVESVATISMWESGQRTPRDDHKIKLAEVLGSDVRMLFPLVRRPEIDKAPA
jgi:transcriptional regulator with XRE-family HTH domain